MGEPITPDELRDMSIMYPTVGDLLQAVGIINQFKLAMRAAAAEIERLNAELRVRDRALALAAHDLAGTMRMTGFDQQSAEWYAKQRMDHARAELAKEAADAH